MRGNIMELFILWLNTLPPWLTERWLSCKNMVDSSVGSTHFGRHFKWSIWSCRWEHVGWNRSVGLEQEIHTLTIEQDDNDGIQANIIHLHSRALQWTWWQCTPHYQNAETVPRLWPRKARRQRNDIGSRRAKRPRMPEPMEMPVRWARVRL